MIASNPAWKTHVTFLSVFASMYSTKSEQIDLRTPVSSPLFNRFYRDLAKDMRKFVY